MRHNKSLNDRERLLAIKWYAQQIIDFNKNKTFSEFVSDYRTNFASVFAIEQMGANVKETTEATQERHRDIPWREIYGMRNRIAHNYDGINMDLIWGVIKEDLPELVAQIDKILETDLKLTNDTNNKKVNFKKNLRR